MSCQIIVTVFFVLLGGAIVACRFLRRTGRIMAMPAFTSGGAAVLSLLLGLRFLHQGPCLMFGGSLILDALSLFHVFLVNGVFLESSIYATGYFGHRISDGSLTTAYARRYAMLWQTFHAILILVLLSNNIGLMWVSIEATTLVSAFLIISDSDSLSIEAMWKYLLICSVGIAFAFMGTVLTVAAARRMEGVDSVYLFSSLTKHPELINPKIMLFAFILIVVGFGTKAGLAPMHTWLPDAHSQAPTPVSALFSSVMLNCALFCIMRYLPIVEASLGFSGEARSILMLFGVLSLLFAAIFIPVQSDMKRFLAYCSVEHIGIIVIGVALGGPAVFAALLHTVNHSTAKMMSFFSAGYIGERFGTRDMSVIRGAVKKTPLWGVTFFSAVLVLLGVAPGAIFLSEFLIIKEAFFSGKIMIVVLFLFFTLAIFIGSLGTIMRSMFGPSKNEDAMVSGEEPLPQPRRIDTAIVMLFMILLLLFGLWLPDQYVDFLKNAAQIIEKGVNL